MTAPRRPTRSTRATKAKADAARARASGNPSLSFRPDEATGVLDARVGEGYQVSTVIRDILRRYAALIDSTTETLPRALDIAAVTAAIKAHLPLGAMSPAVITALVSDDAQRAMLAGLSPVQLLAVVDLCERHLLANDREGIARDLQRVGA